MRTWPALAGAAVVALLALGVGAGGAGAPEPDRVEQVSTSDRHDDGKARGHEGREKPGKSWKDALPGRPEDPGRLEDPGKAHERRPARPDDAPTGNGPPPHVTDRPDHPLHGEACIRPARYEGGPLEACPWTRVEGRIVPAEPAPTP